MRGLVDSLIRPVMTAIMAVVVANCSTDCRAHDASGPALNAAYVAETAKCVRDAQTVQESRKCRSNVNWRYGLCPSSDPGLPCGGE